jgi:hypothetical protein
MNWVGSTSYHLIFNKSYIEQVHIVKSIMETVKVLDIPLVKHTVHTYNRDIAKSNPADRVSTQIARQINSLSKSPTRCKQDNKTKKGKSCKRDW